MQHANSESIETLEALLQPTGIDPSTQMGVFPLGSDVATPGDSEPASARSGLRAARIASVMQQINKGFADHQFSTRVLASQLGLSVRYVQDLLQGTGASITDRIMDLRLQKARDLLSDHGAGSMKISEVALNCGFNELSYFHRSFRRRFGTTPGKFRNEMRD